MSCWALLSWFRFSESLNINNTADTDKRQENERANCIKNLCCVEILCTMEWTAFLLCTKEDSLGVFTCRCLMTMNHSDTHHCTKDCCVGCKERWKIGHIGGLIITATNINLLYVNILQKGLKKCWIYLSSELNSPSIWSHKQVFCLFCWRFKGLHVLSIYWRLLPSILLTQCSFRVLL